MAAEWIPQTELAFARAVHFAACLALVGYGAFERLLTREQAAGLAWRRSAQAFQAVAYPALLFSGIAWFFFVARAMGGDGLPATLRAVAEQTAFGAVQRWRIAFFLFAALPAWLAARSGAPQPAWARLSLAGSVALSVSLAWAGHGGTGPHPLGHRAADAIHLATAGVWPGGLLPLALYLRGARADIGLLRRFSAASLGAVALLTATGLVNAFCLVGSRAALLHTAYGAVLVAKGIVFLAMVAIGAVNLRRLSSAPESGGGSALRRNVRLELWGAGAVVVLVAVLGLLPPAFSPPLGTGGSLNPPANSAIHPHPLRL